MSEHALIGDFFGKGNSVIRDVPIGPGDERPARIEHVLDPVLSRMLQDWTDWDVAMFYLGVCLGLFEGTTMDWYYRGKGTAWSDQDRRSCLLRDFLSQLVKLGVVEERMEGDTQFRWRGRHRSQDAD